MGYFESLRRGLSSLHVRLTFYYMVDSRRACWFGNRELTAREDFEWIWVGCMKYEGSPSVSMVCQKIHFWAFLAFLL